MVQRNPAEIARELLLLSDAQLDKRLREGLAVEPGALLEALRNEASRHYQADATEARRIAQRALVIARGLGDPLATGWAQRTQAEALLFSGRVRDADQAYVKAIQAWREARAAGLRGQLLAARTHVLALQGRMEQVEPAAREAAALLEAAGDRVYLAKLAMNLGSIHFQRDEYPEALDAYERAGALFRKLRVRDQTVAGLDVNRAVALTQLDRDTEALELFARLERDCARRGFELLQAQVRMNIGYVHSLRGDFDLALEQLGRATEYFRRTDHPANLGNCLVNRAEIYQQLNLPGEALEMCRSAAGLLETAGLPYDRALALSQGAMAQLATGDPDAALVSVREAAALFRKERNPARVALMSYLGAEALARKGRRAAARRRALAACEAFRDLRLVRWEAAAGALWVRLRSGEDPAARRRDLKKLLRKVPAQIYPLQALALIELLGQAQEQAGSTRLAARSYARAVEHLDSLRVRVPTEDSKISFLRDKTHLHDRLLRIELGRARPEAQQLFHWMERARAQSLWDRLRDPARWSAGAVRGALGAQRRRISWLHARLSRLELGTADERSRAGELRGELRRAEECFARGLRHQSETGARPRRRATPGPADDLDLAALVRSLPRGCGFLGYHVAQDFALALGATPDGPFWCRLAPDLAGRLEQLTARLDFQWSAAALDSVRRAGKSRRAGRAGEKQLQTTANTILAELYDLLWEPLVDHGIPTDLNWIVSPHGALHRVPLHALLGRRGYLAEHTMIQLVPSARIWREVARRRRRRPRRAYLAALPTPELPAVKREVELAAARLRGWETRIDLAPTRATLEREARRAGLVHIAAHGELRADNPAFSCIHLADGPLYVHDLAVLRLSGATVILTACSSGRGIAPAGDEWVGLARGFLQAGAVQVVAGLWSIQDEATCDLMEGFYTGLAADLPPGDSLRQAMATLRKTRPHPWQWASFAVLGGSGAARRC